MLLPQVRHAVDTWKRAPINAQESRPLIYSATQIEFDTSKDVGSRVQVNLLPWAATGQREQNHTRALARQQLNRLWGISLPPLDADTAPVSTSVTPFFGALTYRIPEAGPGFLRRFYADEPLSQTD